MKTIKLDGVYKRLKEQEAEVYVNLKGWFYCPKEEYKKATRVPVVVAEPKVVVEKPKKEKNVKQSKHTASK